MANASNTLLWHFNYFPNLVSERYVNRKSLSKNLGDSATTALE